MRNRWKKCVGDFELCRNSSQGGCSYFDFSLELSHRNQYTADTACTYNSQSLQSHIIFEKRRQLLLGDTYGLKPIVKVRSNEYHRTMNINTKLPPIGKGLNLDLITETVGPYIWFLLSMCPINMVQHYGHFSSLNSNSYLKHIRFYEKLYLKGWNANSNN